jgi:hypothetical protein
MPTGEACQMSTSTPGIGLPSGSTTSPRMNSAGPGVSERRIEPPFSTRGECMRQNGPSSAAAVSVGPPAPLFIRQTSVDRPSTSDIRIISLWRVGAGLAGADQGVEALPPIPPP